MNDALLQMLGTPLFDPRIRHQLPLRDYMDLTINRMRKIVETGLITNDMWLGQPRQSDFRQMLEHTAIAGAYDYALFSSIVDHMIAGNALFAQGDVLQVARYRQEVIELGAVYAFGCTEINSGSDVRNLQTVVTHDALNQCLILHTPSPAACKFWIGNALHAAQVVMVLGRLIVNGEDEGLHWFRVPIRKAENGPLLPGVNVTACDPKGGIHANQVAGICFSQMKLPLDAMMQRHARFTHDGEFISDVPRDRRVTRAMETFIQERLFLLAAARGGAGLCAHLAYRFVCHRQVKNALVNEPLLAKPLIRQRLYVEQLKALALKLLEQAILSRFETMWGQPDKRQELHILAAIAKSVGTWVGLDVMRMCREICGSQGFHHYNQIVTLCTDCEISITFAGDNSVMTYQVARDAVTRPRFASRPTGNVAQRIEKNIVELCRDPSEVSHRQALALTYARALDLIIVEVERNHLVTPQTLQDLLHVFAPQLSEGGLAVESAEFNDHATEAQLALLAKLLEPPADLVSAPIDDPDYIQHFTAALYKSDTQSLLDFTNRDTVRDPYPAYSYLREHHPVYWSPHFNAWFLTRFSDVFAAQGDAKRYSSNRMQQLVDAQVPPEKRAQLASFVKLASEWMYSQDGCPHTASRKLLGKAFTPRSIESLRQSIQDITDEALSRLEPQTDLMANLFNRVPALVLAKLYGIPPEDALKLRHWTDDILIFLVGNLDPDYGPAQALKGVEEMYAYFADVIGQRRQQPEDDLVSRVLEASLENASSNDEVLAQIVFILVAGYTTSADQLCIGLLHLLEHPEQLEALKADPLRVKPAIEEMLRFDSAGSFSHRVLNEDVTIGDITMKKGDLVYLMRASANRDPDKFKKPDSFDINRKNNDHLAFGRGEHFCMGTALFRIEAEVVFTSLFKRFPTLSLIAGKPAIWRTNNLQFRGLKELPIDLGKGVEQ
ncbi:cytochrome P450/alkylation response protein AidB-like acyl-CoA dehydrogenase [Pseudomonas sp. BT76 TE3572]|uniref:cytochrome P450 n=1 Tax=Pseudomonas sp. BT76 TE3572 TaxID=3349325 RepID=UPI003D1B9B0D